MRSTPFFAIGWNQALATLFCFLLLPGQPQTVLAQSTATCRNVGGQTLLFFPLQNIQPQTETTLIPNQSFENTALPGAYQNYHLPLTTSQFARITIKTGDEPLSIKLFGPEAKQLMWIDHNFYSSFQMAAGSRQL